MCSPVSLQEGVKTENDHINLKVAGQDGSVVQFKIKRHTPLSKLMKAYCERQVCTCPCVPVCELVSCVCPCVPLCLHIGLMCMYGPTCVQGFASRSSVFPCSCACVSVDSFTCPRVCGHVS